MIFMFKLLLRWIDIQIGVEADALQSDTSDGNMARGKRIGFSWSRRHARSGAYRTRIKRGSDTHGLFYKTSLVITGK